MCLPSLTPYSYQWDDGDRWMNGSIGHCVCEHFHIHVSRICTTRIFQTVFPHFGNYKSSIIMIFERKNTYTHTR